jgi:hypothetical protein
MFLMGITRLEQFDRNLFVEGYGPAATR